MDTYLLILLAWSLVALGAAVAIALNDQGIGGVWNVRFPLLFSCFLLMPAWIPLVLLGQLLHWCARSPRGHWNDEGSWRHGESFRFWGLAWRRTAFGLLREAKSKEAKK